MPPKSSTATVGAHRRANIIQHTLNLSASELDRAINTPTFRRAWRLYFEQSIKALKDKARKEKKKLNSDPSLTMLENMIKNAKAQCLDVGDPLVMPEGSFDRTK